MNPRGLRTAGLVAIFLFCALVPATAADAAKFLAGQGKAEYRISEGAPWQPLEARTVLAEGTEVRTSAGATCTLLAGADFSSAIRLKENTRIRLVSREPFRAELKEGRVLSMVGRLGAGSSFSIVTPTAVASARGTGWGEELDRVEVFEDTVDVQTSGGDSTRISEGSGVEIGEDGSLGDPYELSGDDWGEWNEFKEDAQDALSGDERVDDSGGPGGGDDFLDFKDEAGQLSRDDAQADRMLGEPQTDKGNDGGGSLTI